MHIYYVAIQHDDISNIVFWGRKPSKPFVKQPQSVSAVSMSCSDQATCRVNTKRIHN